MQLKPFNLCNQEELDHTVPNKNVLLMFSIILIEFMLKNTLGKISN